MVKLTGQSPDEVRAWAWPDVVHFLAYCQLEAEESAPGPSAPGAAPPRALASQRNTRTIVYRVRPPAQE